LWGVGAAAQECGNELTASGNARPTEAWAKSLAVNMWRRQVQATYGEQYEDVANARDVNYRCSGTSLGKRCTITATPCRVAGTSRDHDEDRDRDRIREGDRGRDLAAQLQRELRRVGCYDGEVDGDWGEGSRTALRRFARRADVSFDTDVPTRRALQAVEDAPRRVCR